MRMILERAGPRVEHGENPDRAPDPGAIVGEGLYCGGGLTQQGGVDHPLMRARDRAELMRQRERE